MRAAVRLAFLGLIALAPAAASGQDTSPVEVTAAWSRLAAPGARMLSGYMTLKNRGKAADVLLEASSFAAKQVTMHTMVVEDGIARMRLITKGVPLPAGGTVTFEPGGLHLMLSGPTKVPAAGETIPVRLVFQIAGPVNVDLKVLKTAPAEHHAP